MSPDELQEIRGWLSLTEAAAFFAQAGYDQRHGLNAARHVASVQPGRIDLIRAALLHDIGKRHAHLGAIGRSLASAYSKLGGKPRGKWRQYMEHGQAGGDELQALGVERIVIDFTVHHHGDRPASILPAEWALLQAADGVTGKTEHGSGAQ